MVQRSAANVMTQAEFARHRGVNRSYISRLAQRGILVMRGKLVDAGASDAVLDDKPVEDVDPPPAAAPAAPPPPPASRPASGFMDHAAAARGTFAEARTVDKVFQARLRRLEFEARDKKLIDAEEARLTITDAVRRHRDGLLTVPDRMAPILAAEADPRKVNAVLRAELLRYLTEVADELQM
jgi:hypothetical protein